MCGGGGGPFAIAFACSALNLLKVYDGFLKYITYGAPVRLGISYCWRILLPCLWVGGSSELTGRGRLFE